MTCFRIQFLRKMWPILTAFLIFILCKVFLSSSTLCKTYLFFTRSLQLSPPSFSSITCQNYQGISDQLPKWPRLSPTQSFVPNVAHYYLKSNLLVEIAFFLLNGSFAMAILRLVSRVHLQEVGRGCGDWMELAQDRDRWRALVSMIMNFRVP